ncbi:hypothetical protein [Micromonospora rubida]
MTVTFAAGNRLTPARLNALPKGIVGRGQRSTTSSFTSGTTEMPILRIDNLPVVGGRLYHVRVVNVHIDGSAVNATEVVRGYLRYSTAGSATTSSTMLAATSLPVPDTGGVASGASVQGEVVPSVDGTLSVLFSIARMTGGSPNFRTVGGTGFNLDLTVIDAGIDPGDTGIDL